MNVVSVASSPALASADRSAHAVPARQDFPLVRFAPHRPLSASAAGNDTLARIFGQKLAERWGQQVVIDNRPGQARR